MITHVVKAARRLRSSSSSEIGEVEMLFLGVLILAASACADDGYLNVDLGDLPMHNPDLLGGDTLGIEADDDRNVIPKLTARWPGKTVPYEIDSSLEKYTSIIKEAMEDYHKATCVRFKPRTGETNYIRIFAGQGCYSNVGMIRMGSQPVSLGQGCIHKSIIVHQLGHAIGFYHEHNRSDRDKYLTIYWQNVQKGQETQFFLLKPEENLLLDEFDNDSIMLYGNKAYSKDGVSFTMMAKNGRLLSDIKDKNGLSASDIRRVNEMYRC